MIQDRRSRRVIVVPDNVINGLHALLLQSLVKEGYGLIQVPDLSPLTERSVNDYLTCMVDQLEEYYRNQHEIALLRLRGQSNLEIDKVDREFKKRGIRWTRILELWPETGE